MTEFPFEKTNDQDILLANAEFTTISGYDSFGNSFNATETKIGGSTSYSGSNSKGDYFKATGLNFENYDYNLNSEPVNRKHNSRTNQLFNEKSRFYRMLGYSIVNCFKI